MNIKQSGFVESCDPLVRSGYKLHFVPLCFHIQFLSTRLSGTEEMMVARSRWDTWQFPFGNYTSSNMYRQQGICTVFYVTHLEDAWSPIRPRQISVNLEFIRYWHATTSGDYMRQTKDHRAIVFRIKLTGIKVKRVHLWASESYPESFHCLWSPRHSSCARKLHRNTTRIDCRWSMQQLCSNFVRNRSRCCWKQRLGVLFFTWSIVALTHYTSLFTNWRKYL